MSTQETEVTGPRQLAARARDIADAAAPGSIERKAAGCASVVLATTKSLTAARGALAAWDGPAGVKAGAAALIDHIASQPEG